MANFNWLIVNRILIGLMFFMAGIWKIFFIGIDNVAGMLGGIVLFAWAPIFWVWIFVFSEIVFGAAVIANWKTRYTVWPLIAIILVAGLFIGANWNPETYLDWAGLMFHLIVAVNLLIIGGYNRTKDSNGEIHSATASVSLQTKPKEVVSGNSQKETASYATATSSESKKTLPEDPEMNIRPRGTVTKEELEEVFAKAKPAAKKRKVVKKSSRSKVVKKKPKKR
jgi:uncharacterized membrane protein YphA (DoxX/SURF4 family)